MGVSSSKQSTKYNKRAAPYAYGAVDNLRGVVDANAGNLQNISSGLASNAQTLGSRVFGANPLTDAAKTYAGDVLGGRYLNSNPQLEGMVGLARDNAFDNTSARFGRSGMTGGTGFGEALGRGFGEAELGVRYADYDRERGRMDQFANNAGAISTSDLAALPAYLQTAETAAQLPYIGANTLAQGTASLLGNQQVTRTSPNLGMMLLQGASNAARAFAGGG